MILIHHGEEPQALIDARARRLPALQQIAQQREPLSDEIDGYDVAKKPIWEAQGYKCCYCETREQLKHNDAEHFRPKARANRQPGCTTTHGYWWLAFTWKNLLFSCKGCNTGLGKVDKFPLEVGSVSLVAQQQPPGQERPLLIDPTQENGIDHIEFKPVMVAGQERWIPHPRNGSAKGDHTIRVCTLDRDDLVVLYTAHVNDQVLPEVENVRSAMREGKRRAVLTAHWNAWQRLLVRRQAYVGLSYDALQHFLPDAQLARWGLRWEVPA